MSTDKQWILTKIPRGNGPVLDLGGGDGALHAPLTASGYEYVNVDIEPSGPGAVKGDAHDLPFPADHFDLVVSSDSLEHFHDPAKALREACRVLKPGGTLVVWVPFLHPFHATDYYRYTPLGLDFLISQAGFTAVEIEPQLGLFSVFARAVTTALHRVRLGALGQWVNGLAAGLDRLTKRLQSGGSFALAYLVVATKPQA